MNILPVKYQYTPNFTSYKRDVMNESPNMFTSIISHRNDTMVYRNDISWNKLHEFITNKYKNTPKVNVYNYACSDGSEAYSLAIDIIHRTENQEDAEKFFPIIAKDFDPVPLDDAKSHKILLDDIDKKIIEHRSNGNFNKYFKNIGRKTYNINKYNGVYYHIKPELADKIQFSRANILEDVKNIKPDNSIVMCRNCWPYLSSMERKALAQKLYNQLDTSSVVMLGEYDEKASNAFSIMLDTGFTLINRDLRIFAKPE